MRSCAKGRVRRLFLAIVLGLAGWVSTAASAYPTHILSKGQWSLISIPADPGPDGSVAALFGDDLPIDKYGSGGSWVLYALDAAGGQYREIPVDESLTGNTGYWMIQLVSDTVELDIPEDLNPVSGSDIKGCVTEQCTARPLVSSDGGITWNLVGISTGLESRFGESTFVAPGTACDEGCSPGDALAADLAYNIVFRYNADNPGSPYEVVNENTVMNPWDGYWLATRPGSVPIHWILPTIADPQTPDPEPPEPEPPEPENSPPLAADDQAGPLTAGESITVSVLANDTDEDGEIVAISIVDQPSSGTAMVGEDLQITYSHDGTEGTLSDSLTYTAQDNDGAVSNVATVTVSPIQPAEPENMAPVATDDESGPVIAGASITINVLANDTDEDGEIVAVTIVDQPSSGTASVGTDGQITYSHDGSEGTASDSLTYTVQDDDGAVSNIATVTVVPIVDDRGADPNITTEERDAARLLMQASFGPSDAAIEAVIAAGGPQGWINAQLQLPTTRHLPMVKNLFPDQPDEQSGRYQAFWNRAIRANDQLRQRVAFALSHIMVVSDKPDPMASNGNMLAAYYDVLVTNALGNFRDLMEDVTLSPAMGVYLSTLGNEKPNPVTGRRADENYARELMQLFSIGLIGLNPDGTEIPGSVTYTQADVESLARVFTGWAWDLDSFRGWTSGWQPDRTAMERPMAAFQERHDTDAKVFLGMNLPAGQSAEADMQMALDRIFTHPNVGPFISKQLIQRLVTSNPSPAYVRRVATVFNDNGNGERGDLGAVVSAILLDVEARSASVAAGQNYGKLRESLLRYAHVWRAFRMNDPIVIDRSLQQHLPQVAPLTAPSVFNFFRPDYAPPGIFTNAGLVAPEIQLNSETNTNRVNRALMRVALEDVFHNTPVRLNLNRERQLLSDPEALMTHLNRLLFAGKLLDGSRDLLIEYIETNRGEMEDDRLLRDVIGLAITSTDFAFQR